MNILITGSNGFLGRSLSESKKLSGHTIYKIPADKPIDICFHFASQSPFTRDPATIDYKKDIETAKQVTDFCEKLHIKTLVNASGWVVYSPTSTVPISEDAPIDPQTEYGRSKREVEQFFKNNLKNTNLVNLRISSVYGPGQKSKGLIPNLVQSAIENQEMTINAHKTKRDYLYIDDFVDACVQIANTNMRESIDINIGSGKSQSVIAVAETIQHVFKKIYNQEIPIKSDDITESDQRDNQLDITRAQRILGYTPQTRFEDGLTWYIKSIKNP